MKLDRYYLTNFRRLEDIEIHLSDKETILVGPNNSGKTSAATVFRLFLAQGRKFKIHDFSAAVLKYFEDFVSSAGEKELPSIDLDLWFTVDPDTEYGKVAAFLPALSAEFTEVGVRISFSAKNPTELLRVFEASKTEKKISTLQKFLEDEKLLNRLFGLRYFRLESLESPFNKAKIKLYDMEEEEGKRTLNSLIHVDFIDAQRNISDNDTASRSTLLSSALADFYKFNLEQVSNDEEAIGIVEKSNQNLSEHYEKQFKGLIKIINDLGFPTANDRNIKILSTLSPESALRGNTTLFYTEKMVIISFQNPIMV